VAKYAEGTTVSVEKSRAEIETMLMKHGASHFSSGWGDGKAWLYFKLRDRLIRFVLPLPNRADKEFTRDPRASWRTRPAPAAQKAFEAETRRRWRALLLALKAKLEVVESGISTLEEEFLAHFVLPDQTTLGEKLIASLDEITMGTKRLAQATAVAERAR
jgi:hypothetical protein